MTKTPRDDDSAEQPAKRKRGRPAKVKVDAAAPAADAGTAPAAPVTPAPEAAPPAPAQVAPPAPSQPPAPVAESHEAPAADATSDNEDEGGAEGGMPGIIEQPQAPKRVVIGVTGEPGAGKSVLARQFSAYGASVVVVDEIGHELIETPAIKKQLVAVFGPQILAADGAVNRRKLGELAFANAERTAALNRIVHPILKAETKARIQGNLVVIDAALLHELGLHELCTTTVYVKANREARLARLAERGWDEAELGRREAALGNADERRKRCQLAVDNSGDPAQLAAYAKVILARQLGIEAAKLTPKASESDQDDGHEAPAQQQQPQSQPQRPQHGGQQGGQQAPQGQPRPQQGGPQGQFRPGQQPPQPERPPVKVSLDDYLKRTLPDLQAEADKLEVRDVRWLKKHDLICEILRKVASGRLDEIEFSGYMEIYKDQQGSIRSALSSYLAVNTDTFVSAQQLRRYGLKPGMHVTGTARAPRGNEKCPQLLAIHTVMGEPENKRTPHQDFEHLTPLHAHDRLFMELPNDPTDYSLRIFDLACPIGKGQRGLIVAQPKCGKTVYLQKIAKAITTNNPEVELIVLLVDERPEEVTDMQRSVKGEVVASTFDQPASRHVQCAEMVINKAKRLVERGKDVVILLDSITRLARAYNTESPGSGRVMSGGIESGALMKPKQFFGAARKIEDGGSLTILATALVDTGSLADTVIFEEFKGTGNMELVLDRRLADRRVFPAINVPASGTRKDDLLIKNKDELVRVWALRRFLADRSPQDAVEYLKSKLKNHRTNVEFLLTIDPEKMSAW
jgi:transcription termination factor Rho